MIPLSVKGMRNQAAGGGGAGGDGATAFVEFKVRSNFSLPKKRRILVMVSIPKEWLDIIASRQVVLTRLSRYNPLS